METLSTASPSCPYYRHAVALLFTVPAMGGLLFGYDIGATSFAIVQLMRDPAASGASFTLANAPIWTGMVVSAPSVGALIGTAIVFVVAESMGRRLELRVGGILYIAGTFLEMLAARVSVGGLALMILIAARIVYGTGIGFAMHAAPAFLGEVMPPSIRGAVVSGKEVFIVCGMLFGYMIGYCYKDNYRGWASTFSAALLPSAIMILMSYFIPDSPRWLASHKRDDEALQALMFVWKPEHAKAEHDILIEARQEREREQFTSRNNIQSNPFTILFSAPTYKAALTAGVGLVVLQQVTGQPSVLSYATPILISAGLSSYASVIVAFFKVLATLLAVVLVEHSGRKRLLTTGCVLMLFALIILTVTFHGSNYSTSTSDDRRAKSVNKLDVRSIFTLIGMFVYIAGYQVGFGPLSWLIIAEVFPQSIRGPAVAFAVQTNFLLNAIVQFAVPLLEQQFGLSFMFATFGLITAYSIYFVHSKVPETRGLTLEEIEEKLGSMAGGTTRLRRLTSDEEKVQLITSP
ncbi:D-xylose-proton symporter [Nitzschia inconspicua]|uniref:Hexose transporter 1 n=1 Tax=Nitzschia inconspicua TaxID=303405 RepID=A0A9K3L3D9_9STRA|nr:D-xylose-proton symporter [Nitzschia inconspicua]